MTKKNDPMYASGPQSHEEEEVDGEIWTLCSMAVTLNSSLLSLGSVIKQQRPFAKHHIWFTSQQQNPGRALFPYVMKEHAEVKVLDGPPCRFVTLGP